MSTNFMDYVQLIVDFIMKLIAFFKKTDNTEDTTTEEV